jgi:hypothetical protein
LQEALEELTGASLGDLFRGISTGVSADTATDATGTGSGSSGDAASGSGSSSDSSIGTGSSVPDNLADLVAELARLQAASAAALSEDPADWAEFGRIQARMQDLVEDLAG